MRSRVRFDAVRLDAGTRLPSGALRVPAVVFRPGITEYRFDGKIVREYSPPEVVAAAAPMFADLPYLEGHPDRLLRDGARRPHKGHVSGAPRADAEGIHVAIVIQDPDALARVERREIVELSPGYSVEVDETPGVTPGGERYDCIRTAIIPDHVAGVERGRQGAGVQFRLDAAGDQLSFGDVMKIKIRLDGKDHEVEAGSAEHLQLQARADAEKDAQIATLTSTATKEKARADAAETTIVDLQKQIVSVRQDAETSVRARLDLESTARSVLGTEADGKPRAFVGSDGKPLSDREVRVQVIQRLDSAFDPKDQTDEYVSAYLGFMLKSKTAARQDSVLLGTSPSARDQLPPPPNGGSGGGPELDPEKAQAKMRQDTSTAWQRPDGWDYVRK